MHHKLKKIAAVVTGISLMTSLGCMSAFVDKKIQAKGSLHESKKNYSNLDFVDDND